MLKKEHLGVTTLAQQVKNKHSVREDGGSIPGLAQWFKDASLPQPAV